MNDALYIEIEPIKGLKIKDQGSLYTYHRHDYGYSPSNMPATESGAGGTASRTEYRENSLMNELTIQYTKTFGEDHNMDLLV